MVLGNGGHRTRRGRTSLPEDETPRINAENSSHQPSSPFDWEQGPQELCKLLPEEVTWGAQEYKIAPAAPLHHFDRARRQVKARVDKNAEGNEEALFVVSDQKSSEVVRRQIMIELLFSSLSSYIVKFIHQLLPATALGSFLIISRHRHASPVFLQGLQSLIVCILTMVDSALPVIAELKRHRFVIS